MKTDKGTTPVSLQPAHPAGCMCFPCQHGRNYATFLARDAVVQAARDWAKPCGIATTREAQQRALEAVISAAEALQVALAELERLEGGK